MPQPTELLDGRLSDAQRQRYWRDGFAFPFQVLPAERAARYRQRLEDLERDWLDNGLPMPLSAYKRVNAHVVMPMAWEIANEPAVLDVVEGVLGPDIMIYAVEYFIKEARSPHVVTMHQDLTYWGLGAVDGLVTAWIALSPSTRQSGCMDFVAGSHKNPILPHEDTFDANNLLSRGQEIRVEVNERDKVAIALQPGQMSLHHGLTIHGSGPNASDDRRIGAVIRYCRPDLRQTVGERDHAVLARGEDRHGNFAPVPRPEADFEPEALRLHEEIRTAQAQVMMAGAKGSSAIYAGKR